jgi:hypothetical protein
VDVTTPPPEEEEALREPINGTNLQRHAGCFALMTSSGFRGSFMSKIYKGKQEKEKQLNPGILTDCKPNKNEKNE